MKFTFQHLKSDAAILQALDDDETVVDAHTTKKIICADDAPWTDVVAEFLKFLEGVYGYQLAQAVLFLGPTQRFRASPEDALDPEDFL